MAECEACGTKLNDNFTLCPLCGGAVVSSGAKPVSQQTTPEPEQPKPPRTPKPKAPRTPKPKPQPVDVPDPSPVPPRARPVKRAIPIPSSTVAKAAAPGAPKRKWRVVSAQVTQESAKGLLVRIYALAVTGGLIVVYALRNMATVMNVCMLPMAVIVLAIFVIMFAPGMINPLNTRRTKSVRVRYPAFLLAFFALCIPRGQRPVLAMSISDGVGSERFVTMPGAKVAPPTGADVEVMGIPLGGGTYVLAIRDGATGRISVRSNFGLMLYVLIGGSLLLYLLATAPELR